MISLRQIRSFVAVYEEGSFTAAAKREGATQSGISQHLKQLESELGVALLERNKTAKRQRRKRCSDERSVRKWFPWAGIALSE